MANPGFTAKNYSYDEIYEHLRQSCYPSVDFYVLMALSTIIASLGLLLDSPAVIIGAMIIAPLMDPLLGVSFSSLAGHRSFKIKSLFTLFSGILLGLLISFLLGTLFSFMGETNEIHARTQPTSLDLLVALASGFMGGYAKVRKSVGGSIYGVAIAISLVPPLSVIGIGLAYGDSSIYLGAALLFLANVMSVILSGALAFLLLKIAYFRKHPRALILPLLAIIIIAIPLSLSLRVVVQKKMLADALSKAIRRETFTFRHADIVSIQMNPYAKPIQLDLTIRALSTDISQQQIDQVQAYLSKKAGKPVHLTVNVSPITRFHGYLPPEGNQPPSPGN